MPRCAIHSGRMPHEQRSLLALSHGESVDLLAHAQVGRVVFTERAMPAIVPVTFALHDDAIVIHTSGNTGLAAAAARGGVLAFQVDDIDPASRTGWSVVVLGAPQLVTDPAQLARIDLVLEPWAPGHYDVCIRLPLTVVTGRRITASSTAATASGM